MAKPFTPASRSCGHKARNAGHTQALQRFSSHVCSAARRPVHVDTTNSSSLGRRELLGLTAAVTILPFLQPDRAEAGCVWLKIKKKGFHVRHLCLPGLVSGLATQADSGHMLWWQVQERAQKAKDSLGRLHCFRYVMQPIEHSHGPLQMVSCWHNCHKQLHAGCACCATEQSP